MSRSDMSLLRNLSLSLSLSLSPSTAFFLFELFPAVCPACLCHSAGSLNSLCNSLGQCNCREGHFGPKCDSCLPGMVFTEAFGCVRKYINKACYSMACDSHSFALNLQYTFNWSDDHLGFVQTYIGITWECLTLATSFYCVAKWSDNLIIGVVRPFQRLVPGFKYDQTGKHKSIWRVED